MALSVYVAKDFNHNNYASKKTITEGLLDIALLTANAAQLKLLLEVGPAYSYYALLITLLAVSITVQVSRVSHALLPCEELRPMKQLTTRHIIHCVLCEVRTESEDKGEHQAYNIRAHNQMAAFRKMRLIFGIFD
jgi:hypothetical protein